jgi:hypothetical protein
MRIDHTKSNHAQSKSDELSRRKVLRLLGLTAAIGYSVPAALMVSPSPASAEERTRRHRTRRHRTRRHRTRRHRTDRRS